MQFGRPLDKRLVGLERILGKPCILLRGAVDLVECRADGIERPALVAGNVHQARHDRFGVFDLLQDGAECRSGEADQFTALLNRRPRLAYEIGNALAGARRRLRQCADLAGDDTEAEALIPETLRAKRMGRLLLYAAVLAALSPTLPTPHGGDKKEVLQAALQQVSGCEGRWASIRRWREEKEQDIFVWMEQSAREIGYNEKEFHASIYFEDINALLPGEQEYLAFEDKERRFTEQFVRYIGQEALPDEARPVVVSELRPIIRAYGQLLAPQYRLDPLLAETFGWDEPTYGLLDRLFQENIHSVYLPGPVTTIHRLATDMAAVNRMARHCAAQRFPLQIIGYLTDQLADSTFQKFRQHLPLESRLHVQWNFMYNDLSAYRRGEKLEILFSFEQEDFSQLEPEAAAHLSLFSSPADYYHKPALRSVADTLVSKGVRLYLMQPLNFLTFLEWRQERELSVQPFVVELVTLPDNGLYLMKAWFEETAPTYVRLVAQSTFAGVLKLYSLEQPRFSLNLREELSEKDRGMVNFLKVYWK